MHGSDACDALAKLVPMATGRPRMVSYIGGEGFQNLARTHPLIGEARGKGMILGVELVRDRASKEPAALQAAKLVYRCRELGLILFYGGIYSNVIEVTPPLTLTREQADQGLAIVDQALADVAASRFPDEKLGLYAGW